MEVISKIYCRTQGRPIQALQKAVEQIAKQGSWQVVGVGTTGSARQLAGVMLGADVVKNEITLTPLQLSIKNLMSRPLSRLGDRIQK